MQILKIARAKSDASGVKVYAQVRGDEHNGVTETYNVSYIRRGQPKAGGFRGWICSCPNFTLNQVGKNKHCKHIDLIQKTYGRHAAAVGIFIPDVGDIVFVPKKANDAWAGKGLVKRILFDRRPTKIIVVLKMLDGTMKNYEGGFFPQEIQPLTA